MESDCHRGKIPGLECLVTEIDTGNVYIYRCGQLKTCQNNVKIKRLTSAITDQTNKDYRQTEETYVLLR